jgi:hypothetical protein
MGDVPESEPRFIWSPATSDGYAPYLITRLPILLGALLVGWILAELSRQEAALGAMVNGAFLFFARDQLTRENEGQWFSFHPYTKSRLARFLVVMLFVCFGFALLLASAAAMGGDWTQVIPYICGGLLFLLGALQFLYSPMFRHRRWWLPRSIRPAWALEAQTNAALQSKTVDTAEYKAAAQHLNASRRRRSRKPYRQPSRLPPWH